MLEEVVVKVALIGYGKMGKKVAALAPACGCKIVGYTTCANDDLALVRQADVAIDFATPADPGSHFAKVLSWKVPVVIGATGWENHFHHVRKLAEKKQVGVLVGANFSMGLYRFRQLLIQAALLFEKAGEYDVCGIEVHHKAKRDAPSGTACQISQDFSTHSSFNSLTFASLRVGTAVGTHRVIFDSKEDTIELTHTAKDREAFARGALAAAKWLIGKQGFFTFDDFMTEQNAKVKACI